MHGPSDLPGRWKALILSLVVMLFVTLCACAYLFDYVLWLHFHDTLGDGGLTRTTPGMKATLWVGGVGGALVILNLWLFSRAGPASDPAAEIAAATFSEED